MNAFFVALSKFANRWRLGLLLVSALQVVGFGGFTLLALGLFDLAAPLADSVRPIVFAAWICVLIVVALISLSPLLRLGRKQAAALADATLLTRRPVSTALEVCHQDIEPTPLRTFLTEKALWNGTQALGSLTFPNNLPWRSIRRAAWTVVLLIGLVLGFSLFNRSAVTTVAARLLRPHHDIPPYSPLRFEVSPALPKVVYGSDLELEVQITGGAVPSGVTMLTREDPSTPVSSAGAFAMGNGRFGQRLQRVTQPVEIAFAAGSARSHWHRVDVMRQPRVESVLLTVHPPAYSKQPSRQFAVGSTDFVALAGSEIEARITSNRPLSGGEVTLTPPSTLSREKPETLVTRANGDKALTLRWTVKWPCLVRLNLKDITGASSASPGEFGQKVLPDQPPIVSLESPSGVTLATPESTVPLKVEVEDDLGLARIDLVRKLSGFRDRGRRLAEDAQDRSFSVDETLDMQTLGVEPGQLLELYAVAHDHNPSLMGIASSPAGRIQIISTTDYANLLRTRATLQDFRSRFSSLSDALETVKAALDSEDKPAAREAMEQTRQLAQALANDFQAFDAEKKVAAEAEKIAALMESLEQRLDSATSSDLAQMRSELGRAAAGAEQLKQNGRDLADIGRVLEMAAEFKAMHAAQGQLTTQIEELARQIMLGDMRNAAKLDSLSRRQQANLDRWKAWLPELRDAAESLPSTMAELKQEALDFANAAEEAPIQRSMEIAMEQAQKDNTPNVFVNAQLALVGMDTLMNSDNKLCQSCKDGGIHFMSPEGLSETLAQMLAGMCQRRGAGSQPGLGFSPGVGVGGGEGDSGDGYSTAGDPFLNAPVYGPERLVFNSDSDLRGKSASRSQSGQSKPQITPETTNTIDAQASRDNAKRQISLREVPERYRDAVRRFYSEMEELDSNPSAPAPSKP